MTTNRKPIRLRNKPSLWTNLQYLLGILRQKHLPCPSLANDVFRNNQHYRTFAFGRHDTLVRETVSSLYVTLMLHSKFCEAWPKHER